jgi:hypothetical protein
VTEPNDPSPLALVTGASSGIGAAFAERLAADGSDLIVVARRKDRLEDLARRLGADTGVAVRVLVADLADPAGVLSVEREIAAGRPLDMLVNNAGYGGYGPFPELPPEEIQRLVEIHCLATARLTRAALPRMIEGGSGDVINVASLLAFSEALSLHGMPAHTTYAACKAFMVTFTVALRHELEGTGVRAMVCCPGMVESEFHGPNYRGPPRMAAADVVTACLRGLEAGEAICSPPLANERAIDDLHAAQRAMFGEGLSTTPAERYR